MLTTKTNIAYEPITQITGILYWQPTPGNPAYLNSSKPAHCLMRWYIPNQDSAIALLSALQVDGYHFNPLTNDIANAANAAFKALKNYQQVSPEKVTWLIHYGTFTDHDTLQSVNIEEFKRISLYWNGSQFDIEKKEKKRSPFSYMSEQEVHTLIPLPLIPVKEVLEAIT